MPRAVNAPRATRTGEAGSLSGRARNRSGYRRPVLRLSCAAVVGAVVSGFALLLVTGEYPNDGPVLAQVGVDHGVHLGDVFVVAGWAVAMVVLAVLAGPYRRGVHRAGDGSRLAEPVGRAERRTLPR